MKKFIHILFISIIIISCSSDDNGLPPLNSNKQILSFQFLTSENSISNDVIAEIDEGNKTVTAIVPNNTDKNTLLPSVTISENATISPSVAQNFSDLVVYTITAEDGSTQTYEVEVKTVNDTQYEIMVAFHNANPDMNTVSWNPDEIDVSQWDGVTVNSDGYIIVINLIGPSGTPGMVHFEVIPTQVDQLEYLMELEFLNNEISSIPEEIAQLSNLTLLDLRSNNLSTIPQAVCDMETDYGTSILTDAGVTCE